MTDTFETKLRAALGNSGSSSRNLSAFALDIEHFMEKTGLFSRIQLKKTGEPKRALLMTCQLSDPTTLPDLVIEKLAQVWNETPLGCGGEYDAYEFQHSAEDIPMRFVIVAVHEALVTGEVFVAGFAEREFGPTVAERDEAGTFDRWVFDKCACTT